MSGTIINATQLDQVRIDVLGGGRAVTIPLVLLLAAYDVLKVLAVEEEEFSLYLTEDDETGATCWTADLGNRSAEGLSPWEAISNLANTLN